MRSIVVLISGGGSNLQAILDRIGADNLDIKISLVLSNRPGVFGLERAIKAGVATVVVDHTQYDSRQSFDQAMISQIDLYHPDLIVMAGFMRILSAEFVDHYAGRMINIHPALLPAYKGLNTHQRALEDNVDHHGATVHYVTVELDSGAAIIQGRVPVLASDNEASLQARVNTVEHIIYPEVVAWFATDRLEYCDHKVFLDNEHLERPVVIEQSTKQY